jgi:carboxypeptidase family protein
MSCKSYMSGRIATKTRRKAEKRIGISDFSLLSDFGIRISSFLICLSWLLALPAPALILTGRGNQPVHDAGWPEGALAVANLKSRVGWWEGPPFGGGEYQFLYRGDTEAFNEALTMFRGILAPALDLVIHDGPQTNVFLKDSQDTNADTRVDWTFTVWVPASWHRLFNNPKSVFEADHPNFRQPVDPPRLDVYIGGGSVDWAKVTLPSGVRVRDERASATGVNPIGGALVRANIFDMATGKPIGGAHVTVTRLAGAGQKPQTDYETVAEAISDTSGRVEIARIPAGTHRVSVAAEGYSPRLAGYDHCGERTFKRFTVELARSAVARGLVVARTNRQSAARRSSIREGSL